MGNKKIKISINCDNFFKFFSANVTAGIFLHNAAEQWHEIQTSDDSGSSVYVIVESGSLDLFILLGPRPREVIRQYTNLTGVAGLPQVN